MSVTTARHEHLLGLRLLALPPAFADVRRTVRGWLSERCGGGLADDVVLCVGELMANVERHAGSPDCLLGIEESRGPGGTVFRVVVSDHSSLRPCVKEPCGAAEGGRGLVLLDALAADWGSELRGDGGEWAKDVWAEFREAPPSCPRL